MGFKANAPAHKENPTLRQMVAYVEHQLHNEVEGDIELRDIDVRIEYEGTRLPDMRRLIPRLQRTIHAHGFLVQLYTDYCDETSEIDGEILLEIRFKMTDRDDWAKAHRVLGTLMAFMF